MSIKFKRKRASAASVTRSIMTMQDGDRWVYGQGKVEEKDYHQIKFLSSHKIKDMVSPQFSDHHLWRKYIKNDLPQKDPTPAMLLGSYTHCHYLEPEKVSKRYGVAPKVDRRTKQGKLDWQAFLEANDGKTTITSEVDLQCQEMIKALSSNKHARQIRNDPNTQCEATGLYCKDGVVFKGRIDIVNFKLRYGADLKCMDDVSPAGFAKATANFRYDIQAQIYMEMFDLDEFVFICVSKADPFEIGMYVLSEEFINKAKEQIPQGIQRWKKLHTEKKLNSFTSDEEPMTIVAPPSWFNYL